MVLPVMCQSSYDVVLPISSFAPWVRRLISLDNFTEIGRNCRLQVLADISYSFMYGTYHMTYHVSVHETIRNLIYPLSKVLTETDS